MTHEEMFEANMPLAVFAMRKYRRDYTEDDLQEAYAALWRSVLGYREELGAFSSYAVRAIINDFVRRDYEATRYKRRANTAAESLTVYDEDGREGERQIACEEEMESAASVAEFWRRARNELPEREYDMLKRREAGETVAEIARAYGMTKQCVAQMLRRRPRRLAREIFGG